jgi:hypothetical protein
LSTKGAFLSGPAPAKMLSGPRNQPAEAVFENVPERIDRDFEDAIPF